MFREWLVRLRTGLGQELKPIEQRWQKTIEETYLGRTTYHMQHETNTTLLFKRKEIRDILRTRSVRTTGREHINQRPFCLKVERWDLNSSFGGSRGKREISYVKSSELLPSGEENLKILALGSERSFRQTHSPHLARGYEWAALWARERELWALGKPVR